MTPKYFVHCESPTQKRRMNCQKVDSRRAVLYAVESPMIEIFTLRGQAVDFVISSLNFLSEERGNDKPDNLSIGSQLIVGDALSVFSTHHCLSWVLGMAKQLFPVWSLFSVAPCRCKEQLIMSHCNVFLTACLVVRGWTPPPPTPRLLELKELTKGNILWKWNLCSNLAKCDQNGCQRSKKANLGAFGKLWHPVAYTV